MTPTRAHILIATAIVPLGFALTACGAASSSDSARSAGSSDSGGSAAKPARAPGDNLVADGSFDAETVSSTVINRSVVATGQLRVGTSHLADARQDAIDLATGLRGFVDDEQSQSDERGKLDRVDLTLRVPVASFEKALDSLAALGTVRHRQQSVEDVTTQVIDNTARVRAQKASVASIEKLLARATTIGEIMSIERQLSDRQAELDSLEQQQTWLADQTSMSTIRLTLLRPAPAEAHHTGFLTGLGGGWHALGVTIVAVGTAVGAVLPFALVLAVVGVPVWLLVRRRRTVVTPPPVAGA